MILETELIIRLVVAAVLGSLIGLEREWHDKPAGLRTHILVCVGAAVFTVAALGIGKETEIARIAAGVVTGIGFLGAGTIFREKERVRGLTTAADLWVLAAIGLAVGIGYYVLAAISTALMLIILILGGKIDRYIRAKQGENYQD